MRTLIQPFTLPCTPPSPNLLTKPLSHPVIQPTLSPAPTLQKIIAQRQCLALSTSQSPFMLVLHILHQTCCYPRVHHFRNYLISHSFTSYIQCTNNFCGLSFQSTCRSTLFSGYPPPTSVQVTIHCPIASASRYGLFSS